MKSLQEFKRLESAPGDGGRGANGEGLANFSEQNRGLYEEWRTFFSSLSMEDRGDLTDDIALHSRILEGQFSNYRDYEVFHILASSGFTTDAAPSITDDFTGDEYSVRKFIARMKNKYEKKKEPALLDLVCVDGRWGQFVSGPVNQSMIVYIDDDTPEHAYVDLSKYSLEVVGRPLEMEGILDQFTPEQIAKIRYDGDTDEGSPDLRLSNAFVFGKYTIKH